MHNNSSTTSHIRNKIFCKLSLGTRSSTVVAVAQLIRHLCVCVFVCVYTYTYTFMINYNISFEDLHLRDMVVVRPSHLFTEMITSQWMPNGILGYLRNVVVQNDQFYVNRRNWNDSGWGYITSKSLTWVVWIALGCSHIDGRCLVGKFRGW